MLWVLGTMHCERQEFCDFDTRNGIDFHDCDVKNKKGIFVKLM